MATEEGEQVLSDSVSFLTELHGWLQECDRYTKH